MRAWIKSGIRSGLRAAGLVALATQVPAPADAARWSANACANPTVEGCALAKEMFGTTVIPVDAGSAGPALKIATEFGGFGTAGDQMLLALTVTNGVFNTAVPASLLASGSCAITAIVSSAGVVGGTTVTFLITLGAGCGVVGSTIKLSMPALKSVTPNDVTVSATLTTQNQATPIDAGLSNNGFVAYKSVDANTGSLKPGFATVDMAGGGKQFAGPAATAIVGNIVDTLTDNTSAVFTETGARFTYAAVASTGKLTVSGLPSAVTAVSVGSGATCAAPSGGSAVCTLTSAQLQGLANLAPNGAPVSITVDGTTVISTPVIINARLDVDYGPATYADETKFNGVLGNLGTQACAVEYASVFGPAAQAAGYSNLFRITNNSATDARLYAAMVDDATSMSTPVKQVLAANLGLSASHPAWSNDKVRAGGTLEFTGADISNAMGSTATGYFKARARLRLFLETKGNASTGANLGGSGCSSEGYLCSRSACSTTRPITNGQDGTAILAPKN